LEGRLFVWFVLVCLFLCRIDGKRRAGAQNSSRNQRTLQPLSTKQPPVTKNIPAAPHLHRDVHEALLAGKDGRLAALDAADVHLDAAIGNLFVV
jgi:hypothetical protein